MLWHWIYLCVEFPLNFDHVLLIPFGDKVYSEAYLSKSSTSSDSMQVSAALCWEIEIDDDVDCGDIDSSGN